MRIMKWYQKLCATLTILAALAGFWLRFGYSQQLQDLTAPEGASGQLVLAAMDRTAESVRYDPAYVVLAYPGGDVPADTGVCTDVVIRSYRRLGVDLQQLVHEDMAANFSKYPKNWGLSRPDKNIDHRRVPNLQTFFTREGAELPITEETRDYLPGDLIAWDLNGNGLTHIGIVIGEDQFVHNIGGGPVRDRGIFAWKIIGHYRWHPTVVE